MDVLIVKAGALLLIAGIVSMLARKLKLPYTVGLVLAGPLVTILPGPHFALSHDLIFSVLLPPLIFEAAIQISWPRLRKDLGVVTVLATIGLAMSAAIVAAGLYFAVRWPLPICVVVAVLLSATDPVSVIATFKSIGLKGRLQMLVEAESLFNDGTAAVLFGISLAIANGHPLNGLDVAQSFLLTTGGGILCGLAVGGVTLYLGGKTDDHLVELTFTSIAAYGSFILAESLHFSGVLSCLSAGILLANLGSLGSFTDKGREAVESFWEYVAFLANSIIFLLIGSSLTVKAISTTWPIALLVTSLLLIGRAAAVYGCGLLFGRTKSGIDGKVQHVLFWGGLRGALALALALGLPSSFPYREQILNAVFVAVAISIILQGITMPPLLKALRIEPSES